MRLQKRRQGQFDRRPDLWQARGHNACSTSLTLRERIASTASTIALTSSRQTQQALLGSDRRHRSLAMHSQGMEGRGVTLATPTGLQTAGSVRPNRPTTGVPAGGGHVHRATLVPQEQACLAEDRQQGCQRQRPDHVDDRRSGLGDDALGRCPFIGAADKQEVQPSLPRDLVDRQRKTFRLPLPPPEARSCMNGYEGVTPEMMPVEKRDALAVSSGSGSIVGTGARNSTPSASRAKDSGRDNAGHQSQTAWLGRWRAGVPASATVFREDHIRRGSWR